MPKEDACVAKEGTSKKGEQSLPVGCRILLLKWSADHHDRVEKVILLPVSLIFRDPYFICTHVTMIINHFKAMLVMMIAYQDPVNLTHLSSSHWTFQINANGCTVTTLRNEMTTIVQHLLRVRLKLKLLYNLYVSFSVRRISRAI